MGETAAGGRGRQRGMGQVVRSIGGGPVAKPGCDHCRCRPGGPCLCHDHARGRTCRRRAGEGRYGRIGLAAPLRSALPAQPSKAFRSAWDGDAGKLSGLSVACADSGLSRSLSARFDIRPAFNTTVSTIRREGAQWRAETGPGPISASVMIIATGIADAPYRPAWSGQLPPLRRPQQRLSQSVALCRQARVGGRLRQFGRRDRA